MPVIEPITKDSLPGEITPRTTQASQLLRQIEESQTETKSEPAPSKDSSAPPEADNNKEITAETSPQDAMRIAAAIRKEKLLRKKEKELGDQKRQLEERERSYEPWKKAAETATRGNKLEALKLLGISYDDLTQQVLNNGELPPQVQAQQSAEEIVNRKLAELEKRQGEREVELQKQNYEQSLKQIDFEVETLANTGDKFPLVKESGAYHDVTEYIESEFHRTGKIIPVEAALDMVEQQIAEGILHLAKIEKIKSQLLAEPKKEPLIPAGGAQPEQKITTLTHKATVVPPSSKPITDAERRQRAIDAFYGKAVT